MLVRQSNRRTLRFVRVDNRAMAIYAIMAVAGLTVIGLLLTKMGLVKSFYSSPFVMLCAVVANRVCVRAGLIAAGLSGVVHDYIFVDPYWQFSGPSAEQALAYVSCFVAAWAVGRRHPNAPTAGTPPPSSSSLPFVSHSKSDKSDRSWWSVDPVDNWIEDTQVGAEYGHIYLDAARKDKLPPLTWIIRDMVKAGRWSGVETGFVSVIARSALLSPASISLLGHNRTPYQSDIG